MKSNEDRKAGDDLIYKGKMIASSH